MFSFYPPPLVLRASSETTIYMFLVPRDDPNLTPLNFPPFLPTRGGIPLTTAAFVLCTPIAPGSIVETLLLGPPLPPQQVTPGCTRQPPSYRYSSMGFKGVVICLRKVDEQHAKMIVKNTQESQAGRPKYLAILFVALPGISIKEETWHYISHADADVQAIPGGSPGWLGLFKDPQERDLMFVRYPPMAEDLVVQLPYEEELIIYSFITADMETTEPGKFTTEHELTKLSFALGHLFLMGVPLRPVPELPVGPPILLQHPPVLGASISDRPIRIPTLPKFTGPKSTSQDAQARPTVFVEGGLRDHDPPMVPLGWEKEKRGLKRSLPAGDNDTVNFSRRWQV
ncbi:hypothetical protein C8Q78DRAFT_1081517 [Trametes maxima]|nr:hypothetical protein C8Q78DRAFT_1081517 [Trametes maxima]